MFLKNISLVNFKGFHRFNLSFETEQGQIRKQTLLLGQNGTGKSNVLKAIALITSGSEAVLDLLSSPDDWIRHHEKEAVIEADILTQKGEDIHVSFKISRGVSRHDLLLFNQESLNLLDSTLKDEKQHYFVAGYGASRRHNPGGDFTTQKGRFSDAGRVASIYTLFNSDARLNSLSSWAIDLDYRSDGAELEVVKDTLNFFLEGITFHSIDKVNKTLLFQEGSNVIKLESLSDGYQNMAAWIGDLLFRLTDRFHNIKSPLNARGLLLIDEIDLHLHPRWQRKLLDFIRAKLPNMQVIGTTHSPLTAQQAGEGELFALKRENGKIELTPFIGNPSNLLVHQMLMSPVFGLETDESFEVEHQKEAYRTLKASN